MPLAHRHIGLDDPFLMSGTAFGRIPRPRQRGGGMAASEPFEKGSIDCGLDLNDWLQSLPVAGSKADSRSRNDLLGRSELRVGLAFPSNVGELQLGKVLVEVTGKIVAMSQRLFPGPVSIDYSYDPENPSDEYLIFDVVAEGDYADYRERIFQWHEEVRRIVPGSLGEFTLSVTPRR